MPACGGQLRDDPVLVCQLGRTTLPSYVGGDPARATMALRRGVRQDQRHHPLPVARGRPARQRADILVDSGRNAVAAKRFFRKLLKGLR